MDFILILGPMKSGKSFELISYFMPFRYTNISFRLYQSSKNVKSENIWSRNGIAIEAKKTDDLSEALEKNFKVVGIDEVHMFDEKNVEIVNKLLKRKTKVIASGLDLDYRGRMFPVIQKLIELGPKEIKYKRAVCESCKNPEAIYTQIYKDSKVVLEGLSPIVPDDGNYIYKPLCRNCFTRKI